MVYQEFEMREAIKSGVNFGLTSGVITTLGLMVGLHAGTKSELAVVGGIITIAIADSMSDALGIHVSKEAEGSMSVGDIWIATLVTFVTKMCMALTFVVPVLFFELQKAIIVGVVWGLSVLIFLSYILAKEQKESPVLVIGEHLGIAIFVLLATHYVGDLIGEVFI